MNREERISYYEAILDRAGWIADELEAALEAFAGIQEDLHKLEAYYTGPAWKEDLAADEAGRLPAGLKRGALSQDAVYNLLERCWELKQMLK